LNIRPEYDRDLDAISQLVYTAFLNHPQHAPGALPKEHNIVNELRATGALSVSLVAEDDGVIIGHIALSEVLIDGKSAGWYGGGPLAVHPSRQRQGIGSALVNRGIQTLQERGARGVALVGDPNYYARFGFKPDPELVMTGVPPEYVLVLPLESPTPVGSISFHAAFGC
jgi:putative acetyltransferase